jgi:hypothetical protein
MGKGRRKSTKPGVKPNPHPDPETVDPRDDMPSWGDEGGGGQYESGPTAQGEVPGSPGGEKDRPPKP